MDEQDQQIDLICKDIELLGSALQELGMSNDNIDSLVFIYKELNDVLKEVFRQGFNDQLEEYYVNYFE